MIDCGRFWDPSWGGEWSQNRSKNDTKIDQKKGLLPRGVWMAPKGRDPHRPSTTKPQLSHSEATTRQLWAPRPPWGRGLGEGEEGLFVSWCCLTRPGHKARRIYIHVCVLACMCVLACAHLRTHTHTHIFAGPCAQGVLDHTSILYQQSFFPLP